MASGMKVSQDILPLYNDMKIRKTHKYVGFKIPKVMKNDKLDFGDKIEVDSEIFGEPKDTTTLQEDEVEWNRMRQCLPMEEPRYVIYDFGFRNENGKLIQKLCAFMWCSDDFSAKQKMTYASSKDSLQKNLGIKIHEIKEFCDLDYEEARKNLVQK